MTFDSVLEHEIGPLGRWQVGIFLLIAIPSNMPGPIIPQFANLDVDHTCASQWNRGWTYTEVVNFSRLVLARADLNGSRDLACSRLVSPGLAQLQNASFSVAVASLPRQNLSDVSTASCDDSGPWLFDTANSLYRRSLVADFSLVCGRRHLIPYSASVNGIGYGLGCVLGGQLGDLVGRKRVLSLFYPVTGALLILVYWAASFPVFLVLRALCGLTSGVGYTVGYVLFLELTNHRHRNTLCVVDGVLYYVIGMNVNVLLSWSLQDWRWVHVACGAVYLVSLLYPLVLPESPRWLIAKGRCEEALGVVRTAIVVNGGARQRAENVTVDELRPGDAGKKPERELRPGLASLHAALTDWRIFLLTPGLARRWLPLTWVWMVVVGGFYGVSFYAVRLPWNPYIIAVVLSACALLLKPPQYLAYRRFDRQRPLVALTYSSGALCLAAFLAVLLDAPSVVVVVIAVVVYSVVCCVFDMLYLYTPELFPTLHRSKALGFLSAVSYLGMLAGTHVERLDQLVWTPLPMLVFGATFVSAAVCCTLTLRPASEGLAEEVEMEVEEENRVV